MNNAKFLRAPILKNIRKQLLQSYSKEHWRAAASALTQLLNSDNLLIVYEQVTSYVKSSNQNLSTCVL